MLPIILCDIQIPLGISQIKVAVPDVVILRSLLIITVLPIQELAAVVEATPIIAPITIITRPLSQIPLLAFQ